MFAPMYQEFAAGNSVPAATSLTCATHASSAASSASITARPRSPISPRQSAIHSTCCSIETMTLVRIDGLPGPVITNKFGNPATISPR